MDVRDTYVRAAKVLRVVDGDTVDLMVDCGFGIHHKIRARLKGVNCPELRGEEREAGVAAREFVFALSLRALDRVFVKTTKYRKGKYGRYLAEVWNRYEHDGESLKSWAELIVENGHGEETE